jgi:hypothetical protein
MATRVGRLDRAILQELRPGSSSRFFKCCMQGLRLGADAYYGH